MTRLWHKASFWGAAAGFAVLTVSGLAFAQSAVHRAAAGHAITAKKLIGKNGQFNLPFTGEDGSSSEADGGGYASGKLNKHGVIGKNGSFNVPLKRDDGSSRHDKSPVTDRNTGDN